MRKRSAHWRGRGALTAAIALCVLAAAAADPVAQGAARAEPSARADALYNLVAAPHAVLTWFPSIPHPGEPVLLASLSTDPVSPLVAWAWDLGEGAAFVPGGPTRYTAFTTFAPRQVRMRVTARDGLSDVATATIHMSAPPETVLQPFPLVRILGIVQRAGVRIRTLAVQAGAAARITVSCRGRGCPMRGLKAAVPAIAVGRRWVAFPPLERFLPAGVVLEVRVSKSEKIGSYTRYTIRRHRLPSRLDTCLAPAGVAPMACPPS